MRVIGDVERCVKLETFAVRAVMQRLHGAFGGAYEHGSLHGRRRWITNMHMHKSAWQEMLIAW